MDRRLKRGVIASVDHLLPLLPEVWRWKGDFQRFRVLFRFRGSASPSFNHTALRLHRVRCIDFQGPPAYTSSMNLKLSVLVGACAVLVAGCSSVPTQVNRGAVSATTYSLMTSKAPATVVTNERREATHKLIQDAIAKELGQKGLKQVARGGQVQVGYMVIVADNASTATYDEYFGYGRDASALSEKAQKAVNKSNSRELFEIGAIVIDVVDPSDSKLLFRSVAHMDVRDVTPANRQDRINTLVASSLSGLRTGK
jgi:hypothetical protein